ncbi:sugar phosphate isomerase/epimerase [Devosia sp. FKR38]|uniref:sugar phosphate isomerase/epimerase family protein n=1 Tax=Devosia sp. FKR38 TaxID=2562312 RepID=UPI0010C1379D|nr:sugar phosphate isomerase/epimerase [Devosia sp. FKR38]
MIRLATAPDAWGVWYADDPRQIGWARYLDEVRDAGFTVTETGPWGYLPTDPANLKAELDQRGLSICGSALVHELAVPDAMASLLPRLRQTCALLKAMDAKWVVIMDDCPAPTPGHVRALGQEQWQLLIANTLAAARYVVETEGLKLAFHPHIGSGVETEAEVERLLADTPAELVDLCFDFGHHAYTGADAEAFMRRHADRIGYYHFKNVDPVMLKRIADEGMDYITGFGAGVMCALDAGVVDFAAVKAFLDARGFDGFAVYEQDMYPCPPDKPLPIARHNRAVLAQLGL